MIENVTVGGQSSQLFKPEPRGNLTTERLETSFAALVEIAKKLIEISEGAEQPTRIATAAEPLDSVGKPADETTTRDYKFDWIPTAVAELLERPRGYTPGPHRSQLTGFNHSKIGLGHASSMNLKYVSARIVEQIDVNGPQALATAITGLNEMGFNATAVGTDKIDFNDGQGPIDVVRNASGLGSDTRAWQWNV